MKNFYKPKALMSIHGYVSYGKWQDKLNECLNEYEIIGYSYKYGFKLFKILKININKDVDKFRDWYFKIVSNQNNELDIKKPFYRPSIVAHSLGTWILAKTLDKYPEVVFDKLYLVGSIIPSNFDWFKLITRGQINTVIYEKAAKDRIVPMSFIFTGSFKPSGTKGFLQKSKFIKEQTYSRFGHSDFNYDAHFKNYIENKLTEIPHQLFIKQGRDLDESKVLKYFKESGAIDSNVYSNDYTQNQISFKNALEWFRIEKDIWSFIQNSYNNDVIGYINAIPVNNEFYDKFCKGEIQEKDITADDILFYDTCSEYNLIVLSIAIKRNLKYEETLLLQGRIVEMLIMSFINKIQIHNSGKKRLNKLAAFAWSAEGRKLCEGFCMKKNENVDSEYPLYEINLSTLDNKNILNSNFMSKWWYTKLLKEK